MFDGKKKKQDGGGGDRARIVVRFQGQEGVPVPRYAPGQTLLGVVHVDVARPMNVRGVDIELKWETQGKGDRDTATVDRDRVAVSTITPENPLQHPFAFDAPLLPWTYAGELIQVVWALSVKIDVDAALDVFNLMNISHEEPFILRP